MARHKRSYGSPVEVHTKRAALWARNFRDSASRAESSLKMDRCAAAYDYVLNSMDDYAHYSAERDHLIEARIEKRGRAGTRGWKPFSKKMRLLIEAYRRKCVPK